MEGKGEGTPQEISLAKIECGGKQMGMKVNEQEKIKGTE